MSAIICSNVAEFYAWAQNQLSNPRAAACTYKLDTSRTLENDLDANGAMIPDGEYTDYRGDVQTAFKDHHVKKFFLTISGSRSWSGNGTIYIPAEIGVALEAVWKKSTYNSFVGARTVKSILAVLDKNLAKDMVRTGVAAQAAAALRTETIKRNNFRSGASKFAVDLKAYIERNAPDGIGNVGDLTIDMVIALVAGIEATE